jgi:hypothetical protein
VKALSSSPSTAKKKKKRKKKNMIQIHDNFYRPDKTGEGERDRSGSRTLQVK